MALDRLMFDPVKFIPFTITVRCVGQGVSDEAVMHVIAKGDVFELIIRG